MIAFSAFSHPSLLTRPLAVETAGAPGVTARDAGLAVIPLEIRP